MPDVNVVSQNSQMPPWLNDLYRQLAETSFALSQEKYKPYTGQRLAEPTEDILRAQQLGRQTGTYLPYLHTAEQLTQRASQEFPDQVQRYINPYQQNVLNTMEQRANRNFRENILPALESRFISSGQFGSARQQELAQRAARELQEALMEQQGNAMAHGYGQALQAYNADSGRALASAEGLANLGRYQQAGKLADIATLQEQGGQQQSQNQQALDMAHNDYWRQLYYPQEKLASHSAVLHGLPQQTQSVTTQTYQPQQPAQLNTMGQLGSLAANMFGARTAFKKRGGRVLEQASNRYASNNNGPFKMKNVVKFKKKY